jgi:hypothetical protein
MVLCDLVPLTLSCAPAVIKGEKVAAITATTPMVKSSFARRTDLTPGIGIIVVEPSPGSA